MILSPKSYYENEICRCVCEYSAAMVPIVMSSLFATFPDSKVHGANMGPIWGQQDPGGPHVGPMNFVVWVVLHMLYHKISPLFCIALMWLHDYISLKYRSTRFLQGFLTRHVLIASLCCLVIKYHMQYSLLAFIFPYISHGQYRLSKSTLRFMADVQIIYAF